MILLRLSSVHAPKSFLARINRFLMISPQRMASSLITLKNWTAELVGSGDKEAGFWMILRHSFAYVRIPDKGLLISWATTAESFPREAIFSTKRRWACAFLSSSLFCLTFFSRVEDHS